MRQSRGHMVFYLALFPLVSFPTLPRSYIGHQRTVEERHSKGHAEQPGVGQPKQREQGERSVRHLVHIVLERSVGYRPRGR